MGLLLEVCNETTVLRSKSTARWVVRYREHPSLIVDGPMGASSTVISKRGFPSPCRELCRRAQTSTVAILPRCGIRVVSIGILSPPCIISGYRCSKTLLWTFIGSCSFDSTPVLATPSSRMVPPPLPYRLPSSQGRVALMSYPTRFPATFPLMPRVPRWQPLCHEAHSQSHYSGQAPRVSV